MRRVLFVALVALAIVGASVASASAVEPDAAVLLAPQVDAEIGSDAALIQLDSATQSGSVASMEAELKATLDSQHALEAQLGQGAAADSAAESAAESELTAEFTAEAEMEVEAEEAEAAAAEKKPKAAAQPRKQNFIPAPKAKSRGNTKSHKKGELKVERSVPGGTPDIVTMPGGKKIFKSWIVSPNLRLQRPKPKKVLRHSKERVMSAKKTAKLGRVAKLVPRKVSNIRKRFLALNPSQRTRKLRRRAYSPTASLYRALRNGAFAKLRFDAPVGANGADLQATVQHLVVRTHAPSVRQRAEVSAMRAASRTLRKINSKRRDFKKALRALRIARHSIQASIHAHHVLRAVQAKKVAARAARRAKWSSLLQHENLRRDLMRSIARALRKGHLSGEARKQAIAALLKQKLSPEERTKLHAFLRGANTRAGRHAARGKRHASRRSRKTRKSRKSRKHRKAAPAKAAAPKVITPIQKAASAPQPAQAVSAKPTAKDQAAISALVRRIQAAAAAKPVAAAAKPRFAEAEAEAEQEAEQETEQESEQAAELQSAEALASDAEAEALHELDVDMDAESSDELVMRTEAQVAAEAADTEDFLTTHAKAIESL